MLTTCTSLKEGLCPFFSIKSLFSFLFILSMFSSLQAQHPVSKKQLREYHKNPHWIKMMSDSSVNFYEAKTAFEEFWKDKPTPESILEGEKEEEHKRSFVARVLKSDATYNAEITQYTEDHKKFLFWLRQNAPYVKEDGTLMSPEERDALIQQELINRANSK